MKKWILIVLFAVFALPVFGFAYLKYGWLFYRYQSAACKDRGKAYAARVEKLERDAHERLRIGTPKDDVIRFFHENGLPVSLYGDVYEGTIYTYGCAPAGCGSDAALLGLRIKVDKAGRVAGEPKVGAIYTNCL